MGCMPAMRGTKLKVHSALKGRAEVGRSVGIFGTTTPTQKQSCKKCEMFITDALRTGVWG